MSKTGVMRKTKWIRNKNGAWNSTLRGAARIRETNRAIHYDKTIGRYRYILTAANYNNAKNQNVNEKGIWRITIMIRKNGAA